MSEYRISSVYGELHAMGMSRTTSWRRMRRAQELGIVRLETRRGGAYGSSTTVHYDGPLFELIRKLLEIPHRPIDRSKLPLPKWLRPATVPCGSI